MRSTLKSHQFDCEALTHVSWQTKKQKTACLASSTYQESPGATGRAFASAKVVSLSACEQKGSACWQAGSSFLTQDSQWQHKTLVLVGASSCAAQLLLGQHPPVPLSRCLTSSRCRCSPWPSCCPSPRSCLRPPSWLSVAAWH